MDDNYHQHLRFTTTREAEHLIDNSHEMDTTTDPTVQITKTTKNPEITVELTMIEVTVKIEITKAEAEIRATTEIIVILHTITDQTQDMQIVVI